MSDNKEKALCFRCSKSDSEKILKASDLLNIKASAFSRNATVSVAEHIIATVNPKKPLEDKIINNFISKLEK